MMTTAFWKSAVERCVKTICQSAIAVFAATQFNWFTADWKAIAGTVATAGVLSLLTSVAGADIGPKGTPSLVATSSAPVLDPPKG